MAGMQAEATLVAGHRMHSNPDSDFPHALDNLRVPNLGETTMYTRRSGLMTLMLALCPTWAQADDIEKAVDYRQGLMNVYAYNVTSMGDMLKGKKAFDSAAFARYAEDLAAAARLDLLAGFPEDSINDESEAGDTIWLEWGKFRQQQEALKTQSAKLAGIAAGGDEAAIKEQFGKTAKTCKGCHDDFKD